MMWPEDYVYPPKSLALVVAASTRHTLPVQVVQIR